MHAAGVPADRQTAGRNASGGASRLTWSEANEPVAATLAVLGEALRWRAAQGAAFGGAAFSNAHTRYAADGGARGADADAALNADVMRLRAEPQARERLYASDRADGFQTSGALSAPLIALHPRRALIHPVWHTHAYAVKARQRGAADLFFARTSGGAYGRCALSDDDVRAAVELIATALEKDNIAQTLAAFGRAPAASPPAPPWRRVRAEAPPAARGAPPAPPSRSPRPRRGAGARASKASSFLQEPLAPRGADQLITDYSAIPM